MSVPARPADVTITHPDKVLFPGDWITKGELAAYYELVAPLLIPFLRGRPLTLERFPQGIAAGGFLQKNVVRGAPAWLPRVAVPKKGGMVNYPLVGDLPSLRWIVNQNTVTPHVWTARAPDLTRPDLCVFDLDPAADDDDRLVPAALAVRDLLAELGLRSWVKGSGSKGFHVVVPLTGDEDYGEVAGFAHAVGTELVRRHPGPLTQEFTKADRGGRILVDTGRNGFGATFAAAYAVRARPGAPVSAPCTWDELASGAVGPRTVTLRSMPERLARVGNAWADMAGRTQSLRDAAARIRSGSA